MLVNGATSNHIALTSSHPQQALLESAQQDMSVTWIQFTSMMVANKHRSQKSFSSGYFQYPVGQNYFKTMHLKMCMYCISQGHHVQALLRNLHSYMNTEPYCFSIFFVHIFANFPRENGCSTSIRKAFYGAYQNICPKHHHQNFMQW